MNIFSAPFEWLRSKLGLPSKETRFGRYRHWEYAQANDAEIWDSDPNKDELVRAQELAKAGDQGGAFRIWHALAERGSVWSMLEVARCYRRGVSVPSDATRAEDWCRRAFEAGSQRALLWYGGMLVSRGDIDRGEAIFRVGASQDWAPAIYWLAWCQLQRSNERSTYLSVRPLLERAAAAGNPRARQALAWWMARGRFGLSVIPAGLRLAWKSSGIELAEIEAGKKDTVAKAV
jgi:TPR repeat protein